MKKMSKIWMLSSILFGFIINGSAAFAQQSESFTDKLTFGGNFGATFGTVTYVNLSPQVGYKVTERFIPGISATYIYYKDPFGDPWNIYGGSAFARYFVSPEFFVQGELENLNIEYYDFFNSERQRKWITNQMVGGGYIQPLGSRSYLSISAMYILNYSQNSNISPYPSPLVLRVGVTL